jgi:hypothetical protein
MAAEYNSIWFNSHKNIAIKEIWEKKRKDQIRTQYVTEFDLKMSTSSGFSTSNNWAWAETLKKWFYTCRTWSLIQKWVVKPINNKSDNTLKKVSDNTLKKCEHYSSRKVSTTAHNSLQVDHEQSSWENGEKLDWV